jgi:pimeloyl-ACP methyl ester carboxylesterase
VAILAVASAVVRLVKGVFARRTPRFLTIRNNPNNTAAIVLVHGFSGDSETTWGSFPELLLQESRLSRWDLYSLGYPTSLRIDFVGIWSADPPLDVLSVSLRTALTVPPLDRYKALCIVAHSMGGLIAQRAILSPDIVTRLQALVLFCTPSGGLHKATFGFWKRSLRQMRSGGEFIMALRQDWSDSFSDGAPFVFRAVAAETDEFVPAASSLGPYTNDVQRVVPGNHVQAVKPENSSSRSFQIVLEALKVGVPGKSHLDSALLAVELREFNSAVATLLPNAEQLDEHALAQLALALESLGRKSEALSILERRYRKGGATASDALGVLGGRLKRRWLAERREEDWASARAMYAEALELVVAQANVDPDQAMYHAVNVAFLDLLHTPPASATPKHVTETAESVLEYASRARDDHWRKASEGDAYQILGDLDRAAELYAVAREICTSPRETDSMYAQAIRIAGHLYGTRGLERVERAFSP